MCGKKAVIIGAGPAGLQVAFELGLMGWECMVYERCEIPMGYVSLTIPKFRLEDVVWEREVQSLVDSGRIQVKCNTAVGKDVQFDDLRKQYDAVVIAAGATKPIKLGIPGEDGPGVEEGEPWLEAVKLGKPHNMGPNVIIVGGGSTSTDCARTALRLGAAKAIITYRRTRKRCRRRSSRSRTPSRKGWTSSSWCRRWAWSGMPAARSPVCARSAPGWVRAMRRGSAPRCRFPVLSLVAGGRGHDLPGPRRRHGLAAG